MTTFNGLVHKDLNISTMDSRKLSSFKKMYKQIAKKLGAKTLMLIPVC